MKQQFKRAAAIGLALILGACASPYQAQMNALYNSYQAGNISDYEYRQEMHRLQMNDAAWQQNNANAATTAAVVGVAAIGAAALLSDDDHHHHHHHYHRPHYRPRW